MRRLLIGLGIAFLAGAGAWGIWFAWPLAKPVATETHATDLDGWEQLAQQYHRAIPTGKDLVLIRLPIVQSPRQITWSVTVNGTAP
jgi:hypothetical protein